VSKKILATQLNYVVHKSNLERARRELARLKRTPNVTEEQLDLAKKRVDMLKEQNRAALEAINASGDSKTTMY
jgi:cell division protein FtsB